MSRNKCGLTLIELLIALTIFSIIILSLYSAFYTGILSYRKIDSALQVYQTARVILERIETDLKNSFAYTRDDSKFKGDSHTLEFYTLVGSLPWRISYELEGAKLKRACLENRDLSFTVQDISFQYDDQDFWPSQEEAKKAQKSILPSAVKIKLNLSGIEFNKTVSLPLGEKLLLPTSG